MVERIKFLLDKAGFQGYLYLGLLIFLPAAAFFMSEFTILYPLAVFTGYFLAMVTSRLMVMFKKHFTKFFNTLVVMMAFYTVYASLTGKNALKDFIYTSNSFFYVITAFLCIFGYILVGRIILVSMEIMKKEQLQEEAEEA